MRISAPDWCDKGILGKGVRCVYNMLLTYLLVLGSLPHIAGTPLTPAKGAALFLVARRNNFTAPIGPRISTCYYSNT